jgi:hypothetical protein
VRQGQAQQLGAGLDLAAALDRLVLDGQLIQVDIRRQTSQTAPEIRRCGAMLCFASAPGTVPIRAESRTILAPMPPALTCRSSCAPVSDDAQRKFNRRCVKRICSTIGRVQMGIGRYVGRRGVDQRRRSIRRHLGCLRSPVLRLSLTSTPPLLSVADTLGRARFVQGFQFVHEIMASLIKAW